MSEAQEAHDPMERRDRTVKPDLTRVQAVPMLRDAFHFDHLRSLESICCRVRSESPL